MQLKRLVLVSPGHRPGQEGDAFRRLGDAVRVGVDHLEETGLTTAAAAPSSSTGASGGGRGAAACPARTWLRPTTRPTCARKPSSSGNPAATNAALVLQQRGEFGDLRNLAAVAAGRFVWAPNSRYIYFEGHAGDTRNIWRVTVDPASDRWAGGPDRLTTGAGTDTDLAVSPDGTRLLFTTRATRTRLWSFTYDGGASEMASEPQPVTAGAASEVNAEVTLDGSKLAYNAVRAGRSELWERVMATGRERLLVASADTRYSRPRWSPDGTQLAYAKRSLGAARESAVVVFGSAGVERMVTRSTDVEFVPNDWSRDGSALLGACRFGQAERFGVCLMPLSSARKVGGPTIRVIASRSLIVSVASGFSRRPHFR